MRRRNKKLRITKKKKQPYNYHSRKVVKDHFKEKGVSPQWFSTLKEVQNSQIDEGKPEILYDNYYMRNESILSTEKMILASSSK